MTGPDSEPPAAIAARAAGIGFRLVAQAPVNSAAEAAASRGIEIHQLAKSLVVRTGEDEYVIVLVPGDSGMDFPKLRAHLGVRRLSMPDADEAFRATGYRRGTITPLGAGWPVVMDRRLIGCKEISVGAGVTGWAIHLDPQQLVDKVDARVADVARAADSQT